MASQAYVDGEFVPLEEATIPVRDRGFLFGDGVYDVVRIADGTYFRPGRHFDRLLENASQLEFEDAPDTEHLHRVAEQLLDRASIANGKLYIQLTRGGGPRQATYPDDPEPTLVMYVDVMRRGADAIRDEGARVLTTPEMRWRRCDIKSTNLLPKVLMKERAHRADCYEALFVSESGVVWEGTSTNVFIVQDGRLVTTDHDERVLPGITRREVGEIAVERDVPVEWSTVRVDDLYEADEVFLTGTLTGVLGVVEIDGREVGGGRVGPTTEAFHGALVDRMQGRGE